MKMNKLKKGPNSLLFIVFICLFIFTSGNNAAYAYVTDTTAPEVTLTDPYNNTTITAVNNNITVWFSEQITAGVNFSNIVFKNADGVSIGSSHATSGNTIIIDP